jgi:hypothetical protein
MAAELIKDELIRKLTMERGYGHGMSTIDLHGKVWRIMRPLHFTMCS